jgi:hypothetical protein
MLGEPALDRREFGPHGGQQLSGVHIADIGRPLLRAAFALEHLLCSRVPS